MSSLQETIKSLGPARIAVLATIFVGLMIFFTFISLQVARPNLQLLYGDLSTIDASAVAAKLEETGIPYEVSLDGTRVNVPQNEIGRARMILAEAGLPNGGSLGYELFDQQSGFGTTSFVQNINQVRALSGELARTITALDPVSSAQVLIVMPKRELFSRERQEASASVNLKLKSGQRLNQEQILGIQYLVANSVPELSPKKVAILDNKANVLASGTGEEDSLALGGSIKMEELRLHHERRLKNAVEEIIGRVVGRHKVKAQVSVELDFDQITTNSETFDPSGQVVRSSQVVNEESVERNAQNQNVTVENNLPGLGNNGRNDAPSEQNSRSEELTNYEINRTVTSVVRESGEIERLTVAVLIGGNTITNEAGEQIYQPRSEEELEQITSLVRSAVGYNSSRGDEIEVINLPFAEVEIEEVQDQTRVFGIEKSELLETAEMVVVALMGLLVILLVVKPMLTHIFASAARDDNESPEALEAALLQGGQGNPALAAPGGGGAAGAGGGQIGADGDEEDENNEALIDMNAVEGKVKASTVKKVGDIVTNHPNETVSVLRNWMSQET
jgi:flagellar M-ring protein FliF